MVEKKKTPPSPEDLLGKFRNALKPSGWSYHLRYWFHTEDAVSLMRKLILDQSENRRFAPDFATITKAITLCPADSARVILLTAFPVARSLSYVPVPFWKDDEANTKAWATVMGFDMSEKKSPGVRAAERAAGGLVALNLPLTTPVVGETTHTSLWDGMIKELIRMILSDRKGTAPSIIAQEGISARLAGVILPSSHFRILHTPLPIGKEFAKSMEGCNTFKVVNDPQWLLKGEKPIPWW